MKNKITFNSLHYQRKVFLNKHNNIDHIVVEGENKILISAPHGVSQVRLGKHKVCEIGSLTTALYLREKTKCFLIAKTQNNGDDANFDENSKYKESIKSLIKKRKIEYVVDLHGLSSKRDCDINLGIHLGKNIENNVVSFESLKNMLEENNFIVSIDKPFMAGVRTISGSIKNEFPQIWTLQVEVNCDITNKIENFGKYVRLLNVLEKWMQEVEGT